MGSVILTGVGVITLNPFTVNKCGTSEVVLCLGCIVVVVLCGDILNINLLFFCPIYIECCSVGCCTFFCTCCRSCYIGCNLCFYSFSCFTVISVTYSCCCTGLAVCCKVVFCCCPIVVEGININYILCLSYCPFNIECCSVGCCTFFCTCCRSCYIGCNLCFYSFSCFTVISVTCSCCCTGLAVFCKVVCYCPCVVDCCKVFNILSLGFCPIYTESCSVGCCTLTFASCSVLNC